jgi:hypothetical protein
MTYRGYLYQNFCPSVVTSTQAPCGGARRPAVCAYKKTIFNCIVAERAPVRKGSLYMTQRAKNPNAVRSVRGPHLAMPREGPRGDACSDGCATGY